MGKLITGGSEAGHADLHISWWGLLAIGVIAIWVAFGPAMMTGWQHELIAWQESVYNNIYVYQHGQYVSLTFGHNARLYSESVYNTLDDRDLPVPYTQYLTVSLAYPQRLRSVLEIGSGGARTSWYFHRYLPETSVTSVELDPVVSALALRYFGVRNERNFSLPSADGRAFLLNSTTHYDIILLDAYRGPFVPFHLLTKEFYELVRDHLSSGGVVAQNIEPSTMLFDTTLKTMHSVFPQIDLYDAHGNVVAIGYEGARRAGNVLGALAWKRQAALRLRYRLPELLAQRRPLVEEEMIDASATVLTDDFAPVDTLKAIERHNHKWPNDQ